MVLHEVSCLWDLAGFLDCLFYVTWAGHGIRVSSWHLICLMFRNLLGDKPKSRRVWSYCMRNFVKLLLVAVMTLSDCLNVCPRHSACLLVAGWYGTPVRCEIPSQQHYSWNSLEMKVIALSVTMVCGFPNNKKSSSSSSMVVFVNVQVVQWMHRNLK